LLYVSRTEEQIQALMNGIPQTRKPHYQFLTRKQREAIDWADERLMRGLLESGDVAAFNTILGVIQDLKEVTGRVSEDHEKCLQLPLALFHQAVGSDRPTVHKDAES